MQKGSGLPLDKGETNRKVESTFRPVSALNTFSMIFTKFLKQQMTQRLDNKLSISIAAYSRAYSNQLFLTPSIEDWMFSHDNDYLVGAFLIYLSKAFDGIPHDLFIAKLHAYGFNEDAPVLFVTYSYRKR